MYSNPVMPCRIAARSLLTSELRQLLARLFLVLLSAMPAAAEPLPQPKIGQCPSGYRESGGYCAPTSGSAPDAIQKRGQCPSG